MEYHQFVAVDKFLIFNTATIASVKPEFIGGKGQMEFRVHFTRPGQNS